MGPHQSPYDDQDAEVNLPSPSSDDDLHLFKRFRSHRLRPRTSTPDTRADPGSPLLSYGNAREMLISRAGSRYASSSASPRAQETLEEDDDRDLTLPPVLSDEFDDRTDLDNCTTSLGYLDLTDSRTPSPIPKTEPGEIDLTGRPTPTGSPLVSESNTTSHTPHEDPSPPRAHLCVEHLPSTYDSDDLLNHFSSLPGVLHASVEGRTALGAWGIVAFRSLSAAQHAFAVKNGKIAPGGTKPLELKVYSSKGRPVDAHVEVQPVTATNGGTYQYSTGFSGGGGAGIAGPVGGGGGYGNGDGGGQVGNGGFQPQPRYFPRPRVPYIFTAAELARRVYVGSLPYGISDEEVGRIFSERAKVRARILKVKQSPDRTHAFAFVQHPDSITADHAIKVLHGTVYEGYRLQLEHVNELAHRWLFSLALHGLPGHWQYRDVSDFLISTIGSFAGLRVDPSRSSREIDVRIELRYEAELLWAAQELDGLLVSDRPIAAVIEQVHIRRKVERKQAYERLQREVLSPVHHMPAGGGYDPSRPAETSPAYDPRYPAGRYEADYPPLANGGGGTTPNGNGKRLPPPPPPPPPAKRLRDERSASPRRGATSDGAGGAIQLDDAYNPFSPKWMFGGGSK
ncbi:hypothetical protein JCM1840_003093 [Sporobolomyces johnsonii]